jgi:cell wall-associated NlpC family hydrolase
MTATTPLPAVELPRNTFTNAALTYTYGAKTPYVFGGFNPATGLDCSGLVGNVLAVDFGIILPGLTGPWTPAVGWHPPDAAAYLTWKSAWTVPRNSAWSGDLAVWTTHIGICLSGSYMLSALNQADGLVVTPISGYGPAGEKLVIRRITQALF